MLPAAPHKPSQYKDAGWSKEQLIANGFAVDLAPAAAPLPAPTMPAAPVAYTPQQPAALPPQLPMQGAPAAAPLQLTESLADSVESLLNS
jgi:hypothetical protein